MVFKKRRFSRGRFRRVGRRRNFRAKKLNRFVRRAVNRMSEVKYATLASGFNVEAANGYLIGLTPAFPQGVDKNQRIGNKLKYKRLTLKLDFWLAVDAAGAPPDWFARGIRIIVFQPRVNLSTPPVLSDILDTPTNYLSTVKGTAVRVMMDKMMAITPSLVATQLSTHLSRVLRKVVFKINNNVTFKSAAETTPLDPKDTYYLLILVDAIVANTYDLQGSWYTRLSYIDV